MRPSLRVLHAIHDFLPRHQAGSEIYAFQLCRGLAASGHHVTLLCADFDGTRAHGHVNWRDFDGLTVIEIVNNWVCATFEDTYRPPLVGNRIEHALHAVQPDVVHVHNLLNLSFDLPAMARARGIPVVATLHDYTLVCASGGQRIHRADHHVCHTIDTARCARCFGESPFGRQLAFGRLAAAAAAEGPRRTLARGARSLLRRFPVAASRATTAAGQLATAGVTADDIRRRLSAARDVFQHIDLFVAPSHALASEYRRLGVPDEKLRVSDYGFPMPPRPPLQTASARRSANGSRAPLRIGFAGTIIWHKGVHVLIDAVRNLPPSSYELKVFGSLDTSPEYVADLRRRAHGLPVHFMGGFTRADTPGVYADIDALVVPSLWLENSPLVIHEAFMAGVPVVGARIGGIPGLIEHERSGLLYEPTSAADLTSALTRLIDDRDLRKRLAGHLPAVKSIDADAREWEDIYAQLIDRQCETACLA